MDELKVKAVPQEFSIEYLLWNLCDGDATKLDYYSNWTYARAFEWFMMARYRDYVRRKSMPKQR